MQIARIKTQNSKGKYALYEKGEYYFLQGNPYAKWTKGQKVNEPFKLLCPVTPTKIVALGVNYASHREEMKHDENMKPVIFFKPLSSLLAPFEKIVYPPSASTVHYEAELTIVIKKRCKNVKSKNAKKYILGYTCANDVSERNFQKIDGQWARAKGFDTFCPVGPYISVDIDASQLDLKTVLNGETVQSGNTRDLICKIDDIVAYISSVMTLEKGDIILTGTPKGVGEIKVGDKVEIVIEKIGALTNFVAAGKDKA